MVTCDSKVLKTKQTPERLQLHGFIQIRLLLERRSGKVSPPQPSWNWEDAGLTGSRPPVCRPPHEALALGSRASCCPLQPPAAKPI